MAFCSMLAFWFRSDFDRMDAVFRRSGLMRNKWDRRQSGSTYGALTLQKAIAECTSGFTPDAPDDNDFFITIKSGGKPHQRYYTFDDTGNAQRMHDMFGEKIRYNYNDKRWMIYDRYNNSIKVAVQIRNEVRTAFDDFIFLEQITLPR